LLIELWPKKASEGGDDVNPFDQELMDAFKTLRRKLARWSKDNAETLKSAKPQFPEGFTNRAADNARLLLAIAELAGGEWPEHARTALERLLREEVEPDWLERLLAVLWIIFFTEGGCESIPSAELVRRLTADPTSEWCDYKGHHITQREAAALLKLVKVRPCLIGKQRLGGYHRRDFVDKEIFERFLGRDPLIRSPEPSKPTAKPKPRQRVKKSKPRQRTRTRKPRK
jgi:hypothetical protein